MQWHWGNIGSFLAGLSTVAIAFAALIRGPAVLRAWLDRQRAEAEAKREEAEGIRLERRRYLNGWSRGMVATYKVRLVTEPREIEQAARELASGQLTPYVVLRVDEGADSLRRFVSDGAVIARAPSAGELEALEKGLDVMGVARRLPMLDGIAQVPADRLENCPARQLVGVPCGHPAHLGDFFSYSANPPEFLSLHYSLGEQRYSAIMIIIERPTAPLGQSGCVQ